VSLDIIPALLQLVLFATQQLVTALLVDLMELEEPHALHVLLSTILLMEVLALPAHLLTLTAIFAIMPDNVLNVFLATMLIHQLIFVTLSLPALFPTV